MAQPARVATGAQSEDLFDCFGDDDDDDDSDNADEQNGGNDGAASLDNQASKSPSSRHSASSYPTTKNLRDPSCGVLTFHSGTEQSLCHHVQRGMEQSTMTAAAAAAAAPTCQKEETDNRIIILQKATQVLQLVDEFCYTRHWMMHVGDQKGNILRNFVQEFCRHAREKLSSSSSSTITVVELGTYCGYSTILIARTILEYLLLQSTLSSPIKFQIYSVDVEANHQAAAQKLVEMAGLEQYITFVLLPLSGNNAGGGKPITATLVDALQRTMQSTGTEPTMAADVATHMMIDFLFIDHDKDLYLSDLQQLEQSGMIQPGTHVAADNVVFFRIDPYRSYIQNLVQHGIVTSSLVQGPLEYVIPTEQQQQQQQQQTMTQEEVFRDGIEFTVYLKDPRITATRKFAST